MFRQYGVIRVDDYDGLLEVSQMLALNPAPKKEGVAVISHSGGVSTQTADKFGEAGLFLPDLTEATRTQLNGILKGFGWASNPADVTGNAHREILAEIMDLIAKEPEVGTLVIASGGDDAQARQVVSMREKTDKAMAFVWTASQSATAGLALLKESGIPVYYQPGKAALSIKALLEYHHRRKQFLEDMPSGPQAMSDRQELKVRELRSLGRQNLSEHEAKQLLSQWGIPVNKEITAATWEQASSAAVQIGYPVVLKVDSPDILHKTESGLVNVGIADEIELKLSYESMMKTVHGQFPEAQVSGVLVGER